MFNRSTFLIWGIALLLTCGVLYLLLEPIIWWTELSEARLYVRVFLLMFALNTFAVLRLYNSIVQNTRFSIKVREAFTKLAGNFPGFERSMRNLSGSLNSSKTSMDSLKTEVSDNTDKVEKLTEKIIRFNNSKS